MQSKELQIFISTALAGLLYYLGIVAVPIIIMIVAMVIDYITGMMSAWLNAELSSKKGIKGIVKKVSYLALVAVWLIINELISVLENLAKMGVPIPNFLKKLINRLKNTVDEKGDDKSDR